MSYRGAVITWSIANAEALIRKYPGAIGDIGVDSSGWAQNLFRITEFLRGWKTSAKVDRPEADRKEIECLFLNEIVLRAEKHVIPESLVIKFNQALLKMVQCGDSTLPKKNSETVKIVGAEDKRSITGTFSITLSEKTIPI